MQIVECETMKKKKGIMDLWNGGMRLLTQLFCAGKGIYNFVRKIDYDSNSLLTILNYLFTIKSFS